MRAMWRRAQSGQISLVGMIPLAITFVILTGGIDLGVGSIPVLREGRVTATLAEAHA